MILIRAEIIYMSKFKPGTVEKNIINYRSSGRNRTYAFAQRRIGSIPAGGPVVDDVFLNCSWLEFRHVYDFRSN